VPPLTEQELIDIAASRDTEPIVNGDPFAEAGYDADVE